MKSRPLSENCILNVVCAIVFEYHSVTFKFASASDVKLPWLVDSDVDTVVHMCGVDPDISKSSHGINDKKNL